MILFVSGGYRYTQSDVESASRGPDASTLLDMEVELQEWQGAIGVSQQFNNVWNSGTDLVIYTGGKYSDVEVNISGTSAFPQVPGSGSEVIQTGKRNSDNNVGVFAGLQMILPGDRWTLNVEGRFIDETAVSVDGRFRW